MLFQIKDLFVKRTSKILIFILFIFYNSGYSQSNPLKKSSDWERIYSDNSIEIFQVYSKCDLPSNGINEEVVYLKVRNKTESSISVQWRVEYIYDGKCYGCNGSAREYIKNIMLDPLETLEGTCIERPLTELRIFSKMTNFKTRELNGYELKDIEVLVN